MNEIITFDLSKNLIGTKICSHTEFYKHIADYFGTFPNLNNKKLEVKIDDLILTDLHIKSFKYELTLLFNNCNLNNLFIEDTNADIFLNDCKIIDLKVITEQKKKIEINSGYLNVVTIDYSPNLTINNIKTTFTLHLNFKGLHLRNITIFNSALNIFAGYSSSQPSLINTHFKACTFNDIKTLPNLKFGSDITFLNCKFNRINPEYEPVYRQLKASFLTLKNDNLFNLFSSLENKSHHTKLNLKVDGLDFTLGTFYKWINDFGLSPYRPIYLIISFSIPLFIFYYIILLEPALALENTFLITLGPFKLFSQSKPFHINPYIEFIFNFSYGLLWFFFIIGIRKRFKIDK